MNLQPSFPRPGPWGGEVTLKQPFANDEGYGSVFEKPIELWAETGDLLITVSSSGKSENIIRSLQASQNAGCKIITFSGFGADNPSRNSGDLNLYVNSDSYGFVETAHAALLHFMTDQAKALIASGPKAGVLKLAPLSSNRSLLKSWVKY